MGEYVLRGEGGRASVLPAGYDEGKPGLQSYPGEDDDSRPCTLPICICNFPPHSPPPPFRFALRASDTNVFRCLPRLTVLELGLGRLDQVGEGGGLRGLIGVGPSHTQGGGRTKIMNEGSGVRPKLNLAAVTLPPFHPLPSR